MKRSVLPRLCTVLAAAALAVMALEVPALAAPPGNDSISSATPLGTPPARFVLNTRQATASRTDGSCVQGASVWFRTRPTVTRTVRLSTIGSDYDTVLTVFRGTRTNRTRIGCANESFGTTAAAALQVRLVAGNTYWVAASACCSRTAPGGHLVLNTFRPTPPRARVTIDSVETGGVSGRLLVHGTARCAVPSEVGLDLFASQRVAAGANVASGEASAASFCGPTATSWTATLDSGTGWAFQTGNISLERNGFVSDGVAGADFPAQTDTFVVTQNAAARAGHAG